MDTTGKRIKTKRAEKKLSQEELALIMGKTSKQVISNWENDKNEPNLSDLKKLALELDTTVAYLIGESEVEENSHSDTITISKDEFISLQRKALKQEEEKVKQLEKKVTELKNN